MRSKQCGDEAGEMIRIRRWQVMVLALFLDALLGDPPSRFHPVAWMGQWVDLIRQRAPSTAALGRFWYGALTIAGSGAILALTAWRLTGYLHRRPRLWHWWIEAGLLSLLLALRGLLQAGQAVAHPLQRGDLQEARRQLGWHLVSRDTAQLNEGQVAAATIESLAENTSDSIIAPLFWYGVAGLPGALLYRFLNTADAMVGYRDPEREWLGKAAAHLDDAANLIPARLTALLIVVAAPLAGGDAGRAWQIWRRDARMTASPNAGHPMSAVAGALGVALEKIGHYRLGAGLPDPKGNDIHRTGRLICWAVGMLMIGLALLAGRRRTTAGDNNSQPISFTGA